ncbi:glycosyltransferase [Ideonella sp.]|uniref:glycosyltransferase n=1 Tax=Ideonella sp. TaxID=1929293 RepID=UPI0035B08AE5
MSHAAPADSDTAPCRVALVMIVRDEAAHIAAALASLAGCVDEMVVLDTGSQDDTVAIARAAGARVSHFTWVDDFSAARNAALALTDAHWRVVLDADERLETGHEALRALRHVTPAFVGSVRVDSVDDGAGAPARAGAWISRVLPRGVAYAGRVHEQPVHALPVRRLPVTLGHEGYRQSALAAKAGRNRALLERMVAEHPDDAYTWYQWAKDHDVYGRHAEALQGFARAQALLGAAQPAWAHDLAVRRLHAMKCVGRHADAVMQAEADMARWAASPDFFFALGDLLLDWAADEPARADEIIPMIEAAWQRCLVIGERPDLEGAVAGRGSHLAATNLAVLYEGIGRLEDARAARALAAGAG